MLQRVKQPGAVPSEDLVRVLKGATLMQRFWQQFAFLVERNSPKNRIGTRLDRKKVLCDPIRRHLAVCIRRQNDAAFLTYFH
jgi:hypothetical protein